jgi:hypothetical protein
LNISALDFDKLIQETEKTMSKVEIDRIVKKHLKNDKFRLTNKKFDFMIMNKAGRNRPNYSKVIYLILPFLIISLSFLFNTYLKKNTV